MLYGVEERCHSIILWDIEAEQVFAPAKLAFTPSLGLGFVVSLLVQNAGAFCRTGEFSFCE